MPHLCTFHPSPGVELGLWRIEETSQALKATLRHPERYEDIVSSLRPESRREREVLAVRCLLARMTGEEPVIRYDASGAPYLAETPSPAGEEALAGTLPSAGRGRCLSISHTQGYAAVILALCAAGVDIERIGQRMERVVTHFLTPEERDRLHDNVELHLAWSAKEAAYKVLGSAYYDLQHLTHVENILYQPIGEHMGSGNTEDTSDNRTSDSDGTSVPQWTRQGCLTLGVEGQQPLAVHFCTTADYVLAWITNNY